MAGGWASALGAAIIGGNQGYQQATQRKQVLDQQKFENDRQLAGDKRAEEELIAQNKIRALNEAILNQQIKDQPKKDAAARADDIYKLSPQAAFDNPAFVQARADAGTPLNTKPVPTFLDSTKIGPGGQYVDTKANAAMEQGISPVTGAELTPELLTQQRTQALHQRAQQQMLNNPDPRVRAAAQYQAATGQPIPANLIKDDSDDWVIEKVQNEMGGQSVMRINRRTGQNGGIGGQQSVGGGGASAGEGAGTKRGQLNLSGEEFLKTVNPRDATIVKQLAGYKGILPSGMALSKPYWQKILAMTSQYDPNFSAPNYATRSAVMKDFASGRTSDNIVGLNTATKHLDQLSSAMKGLGNTRVQGYNTLKNWTSEQFGAPEPTNYGMVANASAGELASIFKKNGATDPEIAHFMSSVGNSSMSPEQQQGVINEAVKLMYGRVDALNDKWTRGMGIPPRENFLTPQVEEMLAKYAPTVVAERHQQQQSQGVPGQIQLPQTNLTPKPAGIKSIIEIK